MVRAILGFSSVTAGRFHLTSSSLAGTYEYPGGITKYTGQWKDGIRHGQGEMTFADGSRYEGTFDRGEMSGDGRKHWDDGRIYTGSFLLGELHGFGRMQYTDGSHYEGQWSGNARQGSGVLTSATGSRLEGTFHAHRPAGPCEEHRTDRSVLSATFGPDGLVGDASIAFPDGLQYTGGVQGGARHGTGTLQLSLPSTSPPVMPTIRETEPQMAKWPESPDAGGLPLGAGVSTQGHRGLGEAEHASETHVDAMLRKTILDPLSWFHLPDGPLPPFVSAAEAECASSASPAATLCSTYSGPWKLDAAVAQACALAISPAPWMPPPPLAAEVGGKGGKKGAAKKAPKATKAPPGAETDAPLDWESGTVNISDLACIHTPVQVGAGHAIPGLQLALVWAPPGAEAEHISQVKAVAEAEHKAMLVQAAAAEASLAAGGKGGGKGGGKKPKKGELEAEAAAAAAAALEAALAANMPHQYCKAGWQAWWRSAQFDHDRQFQVQLQQLHAQPDSASHAALSAVAAAGTAEDGSGATPAADAQWRPAQAALLVHPGYAALCKSRTDLAKALTPTVLASQYTATLELLTAQVQQQRTAASEEEAATAAAGKGGKGGSKKSKEGDDAEQEPAEVEAARALQRGSAERNRTAAVAVTQAAVRKEAEAAATNSTDSDGTLYERKHSSDEPSCPSPAPAPNAVGEATSGWLALPACQHGLVLLPAGTLAVAPQALTGQQQGQFRLVFKECTPRVPYANAVPDAVLNLQVTQIAEPPSA